MAFGFAQYKADPFTQLVLTRVSGCARAPSRASAGGRVVAAPAGAGPAVGCARAARRRAGRRLARGRGGSAASLLLRPRSRMDRKVPSRRKTGAAAPQRGAPLRPEATCTTARAPVARRDGTPSGPATSGSLKGRCRESCSRRLSKFSATNSRDRSVVRCGCASARQEDSGSSSIEVSAVARQCRDSRCAGGLDRDADRVEYQLLRAAEVVVVDENDFVDERDHAGE